MDADQESGAAYKNNMALFTFLSKMRSNENVQMPKFDPKRAQGQQYLRIATAQKVETKYFEAKCF
jgi:hypothetical protein